MGYPTRQYRKPASRGSQGVTTVSKPKPPSNDNWPLRRLPKPANDNIKRARKLARRSSSLLRIHPLVRTANTLWEIYQLTEGLFALGEFPFNGSWYQVGECATPIPPTASILPDIGRYHNGQTWDDLSDACQGGQTAGNNVDWETGTVPSGQVTVARLRCHYNKFGLTRWRFIETWWRDDATDAEATPGKVADLPFPLPEKVLPKGDPWHLPIHRQVPVPKPYPVKQPYMNPNRSPTEQTIRGPLPLPAIKPGTLRKPPGSGERERKAKVTGPAAALKWFMDNIGGPITEGIDALGALYDALPEERRTWRHPPPQFMAQQIWRYYDEIDIEQAVLNLITNEIKDRIIGNLSNIDYSGHPDYALPHGELPIGLHSGPAI